MAKTYKIKPNISGKNVDFKVQYKAELNTEQYEAVSTFNGPILCIAGAGSGKTRILVYRVAMMIETGISPASILLLTFTRKAANNMLKRVSELVGDNTGKVAGGTYHSFANMLLRQHGKAINIPPNFSIMDETDAGDIINLIRAELDLTKKETRFPQKRTLLQVFSKVVNQERTIDDIMTNDYSHFDEHTEDIKLIHTAFTVYKSDNNLLDYDDLLIFLHKLLKDKPDIREVISRKYKYIMADEYQDTNGLQAKITLLLGDSHKNIMVVGDDAQSIYSFRGARVKNILEFPRQFDNCKIIKLERNYRSVNAILTATNKLMENAKECYKKNLYTTEENGEKPADIRCFSDEEQAMFVASRILDLREEGVPLEKMAVLFRSGFHSYTLELELKRRNIPYVKWGGFKFLETAHLKDVIAHMRVLHNPNDQVSWLRLLMLLEGVGPKSATKIFKSMVATKKTGDFSSINVQAKIRKGLDQLSLALATASKHMDKGPSRVLEAISDYYFPILKEKFDNYPKRMKDIDQLSKICESYKSVSDFLSDIALEPPKEAVEGALEVDPDDECLVLSTIHSAKGLEWHSVFIIWALEGRFPSHSSMKSEEAIEEERRLMYVAMTRAERNLTISYPANVWDQASMALMSEPSRFLKEIGETYLEKWQISS